MSVGWDRWCGWLDLVRNPVARKVFVVGRGNRDLICVLLFTAQTGRDSVGDV